MSKFSKNMSYDKALEKAMRYCSFQERCVLDMEKRLYAWNVKKTEWEKIINYLIEEDYLNENRYVEAFVRGKFRMKKWGRNKIKMGLIAKRVFNEKDFINVFNKEIDVKTYEKVIKELIEKKNRLIDEPDSHKKRDKLFRFMLSRGFEPDLIVKELEFI